MKKILSFAIIICIFAAILSGCGEASTPSGSVPTEGSETNTEKSQYTWPANLGEVDYDGYKFRVLTWGNEYGGVHWLSYDFFYDKDLEGDILNDSVNLRDTLVEQKLNVDIEYVQQPGDNIIDYARNSIMSGSDDFDITAIRLEDTGTLAGEGLMLDLNSYGNILNLDQSWWDQDMNSQLSIANKLFFTTSDLSLVDKQGSVCIFFTKSMIDKYKLCEDEDNGLYSVVEKGEWTLDRMYEMVKAVTRDSDGDGQMTDQDTYGSVGEYFDLAAMLIASGSHVTEKDADDIPQYVWGDQADELYTNYNIIYNFIMNPDLSINSVDMERYGHDDPWIEGFGGMMTQERVLFNITDMNRCILYRNLDFVFGIVPLPKANKAQPEYYTPIDIGNCIAIPITVEDPERTATILEALTCIAEQTSYNAYIEKSLTYKYLRDDDSVEMLDIIFGHRRVDICDIYGWAGGNKSTFGSGPSPSTTTSLITKQSNFIKKSIEKALKNFVDTVDKKG